MQSLLQYRELGQQLERDFGEGKLGSSPPPERINSNTTLADVERSKEMKRDGDEDNFIVRFNGEDDPLNPKNWSLGKKWRAMGTVGMTGFLVGWSSSIDSGISKQAASEFGVSDTVEALATGLFLIAFGVGALFAAPFSETVGRNPVYIVTLILFMIFVMASALSPNIGAQLAFRFLAGLFATTPLTTFGGSMSDMFNPTDRTYVFPVCACLSFLGPFLAPMVGALIGASGTTWRWAEWCTLILAAVITGSIALFTPETYSPILLQWKAKHLRRITGDSRYRAESEQQQISLLRKLLINSTRPFQMCFKEVTVALFSLYLSVVYIVLFGFLPGFDFIYGEIYHFSQGQVGLAFIGMNVGFLIALSIVPIIYIKYNNKRVRQGISPSDHLAPEQRLVYGMLGAPWLPISLFWMAWTSDTYISPWSSLVASVTFGFAVQGIFISTYQYLIDSYEAYAASALATATFLRYLAAGAMQVVALPMYKNLGVHWTLTLLGCISLLLTPLPYLFYLYGDRIRNGQKK